MLRKQALNAVWPLQNKLTENNWVLSPVEGTPLATLVKANLKAGDTFYIQEGNDFTPPDRLLEKNSLEKDQLGINRHDLVLTELVDTIGKSLGNQLDVARNIVQPMVKEAFEKIENEERKRHRVNQCQYDIVPMFFNGIWDSSILESMTDKYANSPIESLPSFDGFPAMSGEELLGRMKTNTRLDKDIEELLDDSPADYLVNVYRAFFLEDYTANDKVSGTSYVNNWGLDKRELNNDIYSCNKLILVYLLARDFAQNPPAGVDMDLATLRTKCTVVMVQAARAICGVLRKRDSYKRTKQLVLKWPEGKPWPVGQNDVIVVNGDVYQVFLKEGGTPEALIGCALADRSENYAMVIANTPAYIKEWQRNERLINDYMRSNHMTTIMSATNDVLTSMINTMDEHQLPAQRPVLHQRLRDAVRQLDGKSSEELYNYVRNVVCDVFWPHTDAKRILKSIDAHMESEDNRMDPREAAMFAVIDLLADWLGAMIDIKSEQPNQVGVMSPIEVVPGKAV
jgi:hypothetical protein